MIVYIPTPITSVEQAERLSIGTVAMSAATPGSYVHVKAGPDEWESAVSTWPSTDHGMAGGDGERMVALLPIEAEEETTGALVNRVGDIRWEESRRYVTPWKPVSGPSPDRRGDCA